MTQPQPAGIPYDPDKVMHRAYVRVAELTMQLDQVAAAYEALSLELARTRERLAERAAAGEQPDKAAPAEPRATA